MFGRVLTARRQVLILSKDKHGFERIPKYRKTRIGETSAGKYSVCEVCGKTFEQTWYPSRKDYSSYKTCPKCRSNIACKEVKVEIKYKPHDGQRLIHQSNARFKVIAAGARWGKDRCSIMEFIQKFSSMLSEDRDSDMVPAVHGWIVAPTFALSRQVWREFRYFFPREWVVNYWESDKIVETLNDGIIEVKSADDPDLLVGVGLDIVLITEAARISRLDEVWANLETRLMSPGRGPHGNGGVALINSTPRGQNFYYRMYRWGQKGDPIHDEDWESWRFPSYDNPYLKKGDEKYLERIRKRYPDRIYRQEILAEFLAEGNSVFPYPEKCVRAVNSDVEPGEIYTIGYDPARSVDFSGVVIRNSHGEAVYVAQWSGKPWSIQVDEIAFLSRKYNFARVVIDKIGVGETLPEALMQRGVEVEPVHAMSAEKERLVNHLAMLIEQEAIVIPDNTALINELKDYQYTMTKSGNIKFSASTQAKHDDLVTAMYLAFKDYNKPETEIPWMGLLDGVKKNVKSAM